MFWLVQTNAEDGNRCVKGATGEDSEVEGVLLPPPRKPAEQDIVQRIEVFGANAYEYFQWMRSKCCMDLQLGELTEKTISLPQQSLGHPHLISLTSWNTSSGLLPPSRLNNCCRWNRFESLTLFSSINLVLHI
ncbi:hypothetical protein MKW92_018934 [Papaver armeniacum]|nr:hypothetical protein MKW92_018934 [Papaver armeniacum]